MAKNAASNSAFIRNSIRPGKTRPRPIAKHSQAHPGVSPLLPVGNRNVSFQPLLRPLALPPYHYDLVENFPAIGEAVAREKKLVFHVVGDSGGVQDGEFQNNVAEQMIEALTSGRRQTTVLLSCWRRRLFHWNERRLLRPVLRALRSL
jgi:hypothetical protein